MNIDGTLGDKNQLPVKTRPYDFGTDAIERQRVSLGQSLIDADFEYGLQATKWQTYQELRRFPSFYETPGTDFTFSNVQADTSSVSSNVTVYFSNAISLPPPVASVLSTTGFLNADRNSDRAEGFFLVTSNLGTSGTTYANTCNYSAKGLVTASNIQTAYSTIRRGGIFNAGSLKIQVSTISADAGPGTNVVVKTTIAHGLMPGTPITSNASGATFNGNFFVSNVTSANTFNVVCGSTVTVAAAQNSNIYMNPYGYTQHRPFDGGVLLSPAQPSYGAALTRQSKKVFRYQSGKGLLWSSGTLFCPNNDIASLTVSGVTAGSNITVITSINHGAPQLGAVIAIRGISTPNINGTYTVSSVNDSRSLNVVSTSALSTLNPLLGDQPRFVMTNWHGASVRAGCFDDQNGMFWEYDGQNLWVVRRSSTFQISGFSTVNVNSQQLIGTLNAGSGTLTTPSNISISVGDTSVVITVASHTLTYGMYTTSLTNFTGLGVCWVIGTPTAGSVTLGFLPATAAIGSNAPNGTFVSPTTRFQDQLRVNDKFTLRGMTHQITSIQGQGILTFNPPYRGSSSIQSNTPATVCRIKELRVAQAQFNRDPLDGSGASGFKVDLTKMQMIGLQYTWYGAGFIDFMMRGADGNWVYAHRFRNNNINDEAYMRTGNMPVRYELVNECQSAIGTLATELTSSTTSVTINENASYFPVSGTLMIDNELISYSGKTANTFTVTGRANTLVYNVNDISRTFSGQAASKHLANTTVSLVSVTCTPSLTHWGSAFLMDGQFDGDRGYFFNYSNTAVALGGSTATAAFSLASVTDGFAAGSFPQFQSYGSSLNAAVVLLAAPLSTSLNGDTYTLNGAGTLNGITVTAITGVGGTVAAPTVTITFTGSVNASTIPIGTRINNTNSSRLQSGTLAVAIPQGTISPQTVTLNPATSNFVIGDTVTFTGSVAFGTWVVSNVVAPSQISLSYSAGSPSISAVLPSGTVITDTGASSLTRVSSTAVAATAGTSGAISVASVNPTPYATPTIVLYFPGPSIGPISAGSVITSSSGTTATVSAQVPFTNWSSSGVSVTVQPIYNTIAVGDTLTGTLTSVLTNPTISAITNTSGTPTLTVSYTASNGGTIASGTAITDSAVVVKTNGSVTPAGVPNPAASAVAFLVRLSPAVSGGIVGDIGNRELLNRAQLLLQKLEVTSPVNVQTTGILNPTGLSITTTGWTAVNASANGSQPSFAQIYTGVSGIPAPGERIFSTIVQANNQNNLDLTGLKEMSNSVIGGNNPYPDGPDVLCIYITNLSTLPASVQCNLFWTEAQA
jgi:hypothetical protein